MNTTRTHTPTPWTIGEDNDVFGAEESFCVARVTNAPDNDPEGVANAQHIVHCVNTHAALVEAVRLLRTAIHAADIDRTVLDQVDHALAAGKE